MILVIVVPGAVHDGWPEPVAGPVQPVEAPRREQIILRHSRDGGLDAREGHTRLTQHLGERLVAVGLVKPAIDLYKWTLYR